MTTAAFPIDTLPDALAWLSGVDEAERAELALAGIVLTDAGIDRPASPAMLDAQVSELLRKKGELDADLERFAAARQIEADRIEQRYRRAVESTERRAAFYDEAIKQLASLADFGTAKSRTVGYGKYGRKASKATIKIVDPAAAVAYAKAQREPTVGVLWKSEVVESPIAAGFKDLFKTTGEVPDGCVDIPEADTPWYEVSR